MRYALSLVVLLLAAALLTLCLLRSHSPAPSTFFAPLPASVLPPLVDTPPLPPRIKNPQPGRYWIVALPIPFSASSLNNKGEVVGTSDNDSGTRAAIWKNGKLRLLPACGGSLDYKGVCISDTSLVGGTAEHTTSGAYTIFESNIVVWNTNAKSAAPRNVGHLGELSGASLWAINGRGQGVGISSSESVFERRADTDNGDPVDVQNAFFWDGKNLLDLGRGGAYGINERGQVVGTQSGKIVLWQEKEKRIIGDGEGYAINNRGQIVGSSDFGHKVQVTLANPAPHNKANIVFYPISHALLYEKGTPHDLGVLPGQYFSTANSINDRGQVVGTCTRQTSFDLNYDLKRNRAFLWQAGRMLDLNTLLPKNSDWNLYGANHINNKGQIVGVGSLNGKERSFLLSPKGADSTF